jgi:hypothetical protein
VKEKEGIPSLGVALPAVLHKLAKRWEAVVGDGRSLAAHDGSRERGDVAARGVKCVCH